MRFTLSSFTVAAILFLAGFVSSAGTYEFLKTYFFTPPQVTIQGVLKFQAQTDIDPTASGNPPNGYFVESTASERFYVEGISVSQYVGSLIFIRGTLAAECGSDGFPCYPKLVAISITQSSEP